MESKQPIQLRLEQVSLVETLTTQTKHKLPEYQILQDISVEIYQGDRVAIVGPTGAGKSYLLRLLNRLWEPTSGKIYLENREYRQIPVLELRQSITLVAQETKLLGMSVKDALIYPLRLRNLSKPQIEERLSYWMEQLHIPNDWLGRTEVQLSTGQRQLVNLARGLVIQPKILLLDEPTSSLDLVTAQRVIEVLNQVYEKHQTTIVMVNHQLNIAKMFCTQLLYLQQGRLITNQTACQINWENLQQNLKEAETDDDFEF
ncbi:ATP-binding cassette domain-containing protein [Plectonema cf. radiosum LEGE 06105]|uniref:ATP-binding cassette domain-containing protein n=1 Tax=Plectonema cf. radiosum LEGE 06105 TaxID=945769 RepID=A0A8J7K423_9CYAN|nr:ATP-binding cassette domain-containing protein [Plectonema radiosum]MBE9215887.1 ATP-binding cassette domain-containing protein [Plectonema cf. radiosum LEGE 06105]